MIFSSIITKPYVTKMVFYIRLWETEEIRNPLITTTSVKINIELGKKWVPKDWNQVELQTYKCLSMWVEDRLIKKHPLSKNYINKIKRTRVHLVQHQIVTHMTNSSFSLLHNSLKILYLHIFFVQRALVCIYTRKTLPTVFLFL